MIKRFNKEANPPKFEFVFEAELVSINKKRVLKTETANKTKYLPAVAKVKYANETESEIDCFIWRKNFKANKSIFVAGAKIQLVTDCDGEYRGRCWIELNGGRMPNLELLASYRNMKGNSETKTESVKNILKNNVIEDAEVI